MASYIHPSGPNLPGHPVCGKGMIYDHAIHRCISHTSYRKKYGGAEEGGKRKTVVRGVSS